MRRVGGFGYNRFGCVAPRGAAAAFAPGPLRALDAASTYTIAIDAAGDAFGWGRSFHGCLPAVAGDGAAGDDDAGGRCAVPVRIPGLVDNPGRAQPHRPAGAKRKRAAMEDDAFEPDRVRTLAPTPAAIRLKTGPEAPRNVERGTGSCTHCWRTSRPPLRLQ